MASRTGSLLVKRRLEVDEGGICPRSSDQISRARKVERTKDLENRVVLLTRMRDALTIKNRMMKQLIDVKTATLAKETHVTSYLRYNFSRSQQMCVALVGFVMPSLLLRLKN